jgi:hypothetical protein
MYAKPMNISTIDVPTGLSRELRSVAGNTAATACTLVDSRIRDMGASKNPRNARGLLLS